MGGSDNSESGSGNSCVAGILHQGSACGMFTPVAKVVVSSHEAYCRNGGRSGDSQGHPTTTVAVGGTDERDSNELGAACMLGLDGIQRVPVIRSIRNDMEGSVIAKGYDVWII